MESKQSDTTTFPIKGYALANLFAWVFFALLFLMVGWAVGDWSSMGTFFLILAGSFTVASIFDWTFDRVTTKAGERAILESSLEGKDGEKPESAPLRKKKSRR